MNRSMLESERIDIISIDPGKTGAFALWNAGKCFYVETFALEKGYYASEHLWSVVQRFIDYIERFHPVVVSEQPSHYLAHQWILFSDIKNAVLGNKCEFVSYMPQTIKKEVTESGRASKEEVAEAVLKSGYLADGIVPSDEHQMDATAVGVCYLRKSCGKAT